MQNIKGKVTVITPIENGKFKDGSDFKKCSIAVEETQGINPQGVAANLFNDRTNLAGIQEGDDVEMCYSTKVRKYIDRNGRTGVSTNVTGVSVTKI